MIPAPEILDLNVSWFFIFLLLAVSTSVIYLVSMLVWKLKLKPVLTFALLACSITLYLIAQLGANLIGVIEYIIITSSTFEELDFAGGLLESKYGASVLGGLLTGLLVVAFLGVFIGQKKWFSNLVFHLVISVSLGQAIGRIGCILSADGCHGVMTSSIFGVNLHYGMYPTFFPVHPTPIYESVFCLATILALVILDKRVSFLSWSRSLGLFFILYGTGRFITEFLRINVEILYGLTIYQVISIISIIIGSALVFIQMNKSHSNQVGYEI